MVTKTVTTIEEYDENGNLLKKTTKEETKEYPSIPYYIPSWEPTKTGLPWWKEIDVSYSLDSTSN